MPNFYRTKWCEASEMRHEYNYGARVVGEVTTKTKTEKTYRRGIPILRPIEFPLASCPIEEKEADGENAVDETASNTKQALKPMNAFMVVAYIPADFVRFSLS